MKNNEYALGFEDSIKNKCINYVKTDTQRKFIDSLFCEHIEIVPKQEENLIVKLNLKSHFTYDVKGYSKKISNVKVNLKSAICMAIETALTTDLPENKIDFVKIILKIILELEFLSIVPLDSNACLLLLYLHQNNAYEKAIPESKVFEDIEIGNLKIGKNEYIKAVNQLLNLYTIAIENNKIELTESIKLEF